MHAWCDLLGVHTDLKPLILIAFATVAYRKMLGSLAGVTRLHGSWRSTQDFLLCLVKSQSALWGSSDLWQLYTWHRSMQGLGGRVRYCRLLQFPPPSLVSTTPSFALQCPLPTSETQFGHPSLTHVLVACNSPLPMSWDLVAGLVGWLRMSWWGCLLTSYH